LDTSIEPLSAPFGKGSSGTLQRPVKQRIAQSTAASPSTSSIASPLLASVPILAAELSVPVGKASSGTSRQLRPRVPRSAFTSMLPPPTTPVKNTRKGKERQVEEPAKDRKRKRKRKQGDDDEAYKSRHDLTAQSLVQQVMCNNTMPIEVILTCQPSGRRGHKPSEPTERSSSFTAAITNSYVCAIEILRRSMFQTLSNPLRAKTPDTGNYKLVST
jgi:hypothetical protein